MKLRLVLPFSAIEEAPNAFVTVGGVITLRFAEAVLPLPPLVDETTLVIFVRSPGETPFTFTLNVHEPLAWMTAPVRLTLFDPAAAVIVPLPQDPFRPFGVATTIPEGRASVNATPVSVAVFPAGLVTVKLKLVVPFTGIFAAPNDLLIAGGNSTVTFAVAVPPLPPSVEVTVPVMLFCAPIVVPVTFTLNVQDEFAAKPAPARTTLVPPALAVIVPLPHDPVRPLGAATTIPAGRLSAKPTPLSATVFTAGFAIVKLRLVLPLTGMEAAPNALVIVGGATTAILEDAAPPVPPSVDVTGPVVLIWVPVTVPFTFTLNVHDVFPLRLAPEIATLFDPAVAVMAPPPHVPVSPLGVDTTKPEGSVSLKPILVSP